MWATATPLVAPICHFFKTKPELFHDLSNMSDPDRLIGTFSRQKLNAFVTCQTGVIQLDK